MAALTQLFGLYNLELAQDVIQDTMMKALQDWEHQIPDNPRGWIYTVARNKAVDILRRERRNMELDDDLAPLLESEYSMKYTVDRFFAEDEITDNQLRLIFATCHPALSEQEQVTLVLRTFGGFGLQAVARAFLTHEETVKKRLYRARKKLRDRSVRLKVPAGFALLQRLDNVLRVIYLMFNEGYNTTNGDQLVNKDICLEAVRLCILLTEHPKTANARTYALLALMCFQASRFDARIKDGMLVRLADQDRNQWNRELIRKGNDYLAMSGLDSPLSMYHLEAQIAAIHSNADSFAETNWQALDALYRELAALNQSPVIRLNHAVVIAELQGPEQALECLNELKGLDNYYLYHAVKADLHEKAGHYNEAVDALEKALSLCNSDVEQATLRERLVRISKRQDL